MTNSSCPRLGPRLSPPGANRSTRSVMMPSVPSASSRCGRPLVVDGVAQAAQAGALAPAPPCCGPTARGCRRSPRIRSCRAVSSQPSHSVSSSSPRGSCGLRRHARLAATRAGTKSAAAARLRLPRGARRAVATTSPVCASCARRRLDLDVQEVAVGQAIARDVLEAWAAARPHSARECQLPASSRASWSQGWSPPDADAVGGALQRRRRACRKGTPSARQLHVALEHAVAVRGAEAERGQRVLGRQLAGAAVRDPARVRPVAARHGSRHALRMPLAAWPASNQCSRSSRGFTWITGRPPARAGLRRCAR